MLATKVGEDMGEGRSLRKDYILRECEASLRRLKTDHIDLYQTHFDDEVTPVAETMEAYAELIKAGKVRIVGASNVSPSRLKASLEASKALGLPRYETLQPLYNLSDRNEFESSYAALCRQENISVISVLWIGRRFPNRQVSRARRCRQKSCAWGQAEEISRRARHAHPEGA